MQDNTMPCCFWYRQAKHDYAQERVCLQDIPSDKRDNFP